MTLAATAAAVAAARATATTVSAVAATAATAAPTATETEAAADVGSLNVCSTAVITIVWILAIHKSALAIHKIVLHKSVFRTLDVVRMSDCCLQGIKPCERKRKGYQWFGNRVFRLGSIKELRKE